jgi:hypothetical protein
VTLLLQHRTENILETFFQTPPPPHPQIEEESFSDMSKIGTREHGSQHIKSLNSGFVKTAPVSAWASTPAETDNADSGSTSAIPLEYSMLPISGREIDGIAKGS